MSYALARFVVKWPDGHMDRIEVDGCGRVVFGPYIWELWEIAKAQLTKAGGAIHRLADGELWPPEVCTR